MYRFVFCIAVLFLTPVFAVADTAVWQPSSRDVSVRYYDGLCLVPVGAFNHNFGNNKKGILIIDGQGKFFYLLLFWDPYAFDSSYHKLDHFGVSDMEYTYKDSDGFTKSETLPVEYTITEIENYPFTILRFTFSPITIKLDGHDDGGGDDDNACTCGACCVCKCTCGLWSLGSCMGTCSHACDYSPCPHTNPTENTHCECHHDGGGDGDDDDDDDDEDEECCEHHAAIQAAMERTADAAESIDGKLTLVDPGTLSFAPPNFSAPSPPSNIVPVPVPLIKFPTNGMVLPELGEHTKPELTYFTRGEGVWDFPTFNYQQMYNEIKEKVDSKFGLDNIADKFSDASAGSFHPRFTVDFTLPAPFDVRVGPHTFDLEEYVDWYCGLSAEGINISNVVRLAFLGYCGFCFAIGMYRLVV